MPAYWFDLDTKIVRADDFTISLTWATAAGAAVDISAWTFTYEANERGGNGNITVANSAMTKSNSGTGVIDTVSIPFTDTNTAVTVGRYDQDIKVDVGTDTTTVAKGTLVIAPTEFD